MTFSRMPALASNRGVSRAPFVVARAVHSESMASPPLAVSLMPLENRREAILSLATSAERHGYEGFGLPETWAWDITILLAEIATRTHRIGLATGILGIWG